MGVNRPRLELLADPSRINGSSQTRTITNRVHNPNVLKQQLQLMATLPFSSV